MNEIEIKEGKIERLEALLERRYCLVVTSVIPHLRSGKVPPIGE